jgi:cytochrome P450
MIDYRRDPLAALLRISQQTGDIGIYRFGPWSAMMVSSPELIQEVLVDKNDAFHKLPSLDSLRPLLGNGLLTNEDESWRRQRKLVAPAFQHRRIATYAAMMASDAEQIQRGWGDNTTIDVAHEMMRLTLSVVGKTLFGTDLLGEADDLGAALTEVLRFATERNASLIQLPTNWPTPANRRNRRAVARLDTTVGRMIADRRASGVDTGDLLSMLLLAKDEEGAGMSDRQVRDEAMTIVVAGHETTAMALTWSFHLLGQHPEVAERLNAELERVLGGRTPAYADLAALPYTLQVFKEAMRLYPPAFIFGRFSTRPVDIGGWRLPAGTWVLISPYAVHRRPELFPDPERFDPARFAPEAEKRLPRHAYIPFGGGPRVCIGNHFALMEGQIMLATLAQRVRLTHVPGQRVATEPLITLRPRGCVEMRVRRIEQLRYASVL